MPTDAELSLIPDQPGLLGGSLLFEISGLALAFPGVFLAPLGFLFGAAVAMGSGLDDHAQRYAGLVVGPGLIAAFQAFWFDRLVFANPSLPRRACAFAACLVPTLATTAALGACALALDDAGFVWGWLAVSMIALVAAIALVGPAIGQFRRFGGPWHRVFVVIWFAVATWVGWVAWLWFLFALLSGGAM